MDIWSTILYAILIGGYTFTLIGETERFKIFRVNSLFGYDTRAGKVTISLTAIIIFSTAAFKDYMSI